MDPDQARHFVGPDLGQNCLQRLSADNTSRQRVNLVFFSTGCPKSFVDLPALPSQVSCYIPKSCTAIDCCVDIPKTGLSIHSSLGIDLCTNRVSGGIEQETFDFSLFKYEWGK